jgi:hypothetical protein
MRRDDSKVPRDHQQYEKGHGQADTNGQVARDFA